MIAEGSAVKRSTPGTIRWSSIASGLQGSAEATQYANATFWHQGTQLLQSGLCGKESWGSGVSYNIGSCFVDKAGGPPCKPPRYQKVRRPLNPNYKALRGGVSPIC